MGPQERSTSSSVLSCAIAMLIDTQKVARDMKHTPELEVFEECGVLIQQEKLGQ